MLPVILVRKFFSSSDLAEYKNEIARYKKSGRVSTEKEVYFRDTVHNSTFLVDKHNKDILLKAEAIFSKKLKPSYAFCSMYHVGKGILPVHTDRPPCKYNVDVCISQKEPWPIFINNKEYILEEGDAVLFSGTDHPHYRNKIQENNFCDLVFFHFVDPDYKGCLE